MYWYIEALSKYAVFRGRARRKEYWYFFLFNAVIGLILFMVDQSSGNFDAESGVGLLGGIYALAILLPSISVAVRRFHDTGRSGWWVLVSLIPVIGPFMLVLFMVLEGQADENEYGLNPIMETPAELPQ